MRRRCLRSNHNCRDICIATVGVCLASSSPRWSCRRASSGVPGGACVARFRCMSGSRSRRVLALLARLFAISFCINWFWETLQMPAYAALAQQPWYETVLGCTVASVGDGVATVIAYALGAVVSARLRHRLRAGVSGYAALAILGAAIAVAVERFALHAGSWSYTEQMPIVPGLEIGLLPLLQLTILIPLSYALTCRVAGAAAGRTGRRV